MVRQNEVSILHIFGGVRAFKMCRSLAESGYRVYCLVLENPFPYKSYWSHKNIQLVAKFVTLYEKIKGFRFGIFKLHFIFYPLFIPEIARILKNDRNIKIVHAHRHTGAVVALVAKKLFRLNFKLIFDYHDPLEVEDRENFLIRLFYQLEKWICSNADFILTQGEEHDRLLIKRWGIPLEKIDHVYNPVDTNVFHPKKRDKNFLKKLGIKGKTILFVGSIVPCFGLHNLVEAAKEIVKKVPNVAFVIRGIVRDKKYYETLKKEIKKAGLEKHFYWLPYMGQEEMAKLIASCDIGVILHVKGYLITETAVPNKVFEYMSSGIPVLSNNLPNLVRFIKHNYSGVICDTDNPRELSKNLIKLLKDEKLRKKLGKNGRKLCEKNFNWNIESAKLLKIYDRLKNRSYEEIKDQRTLLWIYLKFSKEIGYILGVSVGR